MKIVVSLIDKAVETCGSRYAVAKALHVDEKNLAAVYRGKRPMPYAWVEQLANLAQVDAGQAALRVLAERASTKKPPLRVAGFAPLLGVSYALGVGGGLVMLTRVTDIVNMLRIVSAGLTFPSRPVRVA